EMSSRRAPGAPPAMGSCHNTSKFGFLAFPDSQSAGKYVFVVNENNTIFRSATSGAVRTGTPNPPGPALDSTPAHLHPPRPFLDRQVLALPERRGPEVVLEQARLSRANPRFQGNPRAKARGFFLFPRLPPIPKSGMGVGGGRPAAGEARGEAQGSRQRSSQRLRTTISWAA